MKIIELLGIIPNQSTIQTHVDNVVLDKQPEPALSEAGAGMQHIWQHMQRGPFIIMSGWRYQSPSGDLLSRGQKRHRNADLRQRLYSDYGLASINQKGVWPEERDNQGNTTQTGQEDSVFIPMEQPMSRIEDVAQFKALAIQMMVDYDQDAVIFNDGQRTVMLYHPERPHDEHGFEEPLGTGMKILGKHKQTPPDVPGWSQKRHYKYYFGGDVGDDDGVPR